MPARVLDWLGIAFVVAIVYVLVRPRSRAGELVEAFADFIAAMVRSATSLASAGA